MVSSIHEPTDIELTACAGVRRVTLLVQLYVEQRGSMASGNLGWPQAHVISCVLGVEMAEEYSHF